MKNTKGSEVKFDAIKTINEDEEVEDFSEDSDVEVEVNTWQLINHISFCLS